MLRAIFCYRWVNYVKILDRINRDDGFIRVNVFIFDRPSFKLLLVLKKQTFSDLMFPSPSGTGDTSGLERSPDYHDSPTYMLLRDLISSKDR